MPGAVILPTVGRVAAVARSLPSPRVLLFLSRFLADAARRSGRAGRLDLG